MWLTGEILPFSTADRWTFEMTNVLLTGAGFTRNWDGWLGEEIEGDLLGRLAEAPPVRMLVQNSANFEVALHDLQQRQGRDAEAKGQLAQLEAAVVASFREMNLSLADRGPMEFSNQQSESIRQWLSQFDAIFTLNQDLLFELHYDISLTERRKFNGHYFPGIAPSGSRGIDPKEIVDRRRQVNTLSGLQDNLQPIFKLHGSVDWTDGSGNLFVVGGGKESYIRSKPILSQYFDLFRQYLLRPKVRLMIVGYGFADEHVNKLLTDASQANPSLGVFHVHPEGRDAVHQGQRERVAIYDPPMLASLPCIGESRRPLSSTFNGDTLELGKLKRFFARLCIRRKHGMAQGSAHPSTDGGNPDTERSPLFLKAPEEHRVQWRPTFSAWASDIRFAGNRRPAVGHGDGARATQPLLHARNQRAGGHGDQVGRVTVGTKYDCSGTCSAVVATRTLTTGCTGRCRSVRVDRERHGPLRSGHFKS